MKSLRLSQKVLAFCSLLLALDGCGSNPSPVPAPITAPGANVNPLGGNWLITGGVPTFPFPQTSPFSLAITFDVIDSQVLARYSEFVPCPNGGGIGGAGSSSSGALASNGTFSIQSVTPPAGVTPIGQLPSLQLSGNVPGGAQGSWSGNYSYTPGSTTCGQTLTGTFTATPIQNVTGTYSGATTLSTPPLATATSTPITLQVNVQQGAMVTPTTAAAYYKASAITGTIAVAGSPCFSHGTMTILNGVPISSTAGSLVDLNFRMDDGSQLLTHGYLVNSSASLFRAQSVLIKGGACDGQLSLGTFDMTR